MPFREKWAERFNSKTWKENCAPPVGCTVVDACTPWFVPRQCAHCFRFARHTELAECECGLACYCGPQCRM